MGEGCGPPAPGCRCERPVASCGPPASGPGRVASGAGAAPAGRLPERGLAVTQPVGFRDGVGYGLSAPASGESRGGPVTGRSGPGGPGPRSVDSQPGWAEGRGVRGRPGFGPIGSQFGPVRGRPGFGPVRVSPGAVRVTGRSGPGGPGHGLSTPSLDGPRAGESGGGRVRSDRLSVRASPRAAGFRSGSGESRGGPGYGTVGSGAAAARVGAGPGVAAARRGPGPGAGAVRVTGRGPGGPVPRRPSIRRR